MEDEDATDWIPMTVQPAWCGWYETLSADGRVKRYWKGCHWWSMTDPAYGFDTRLILKPLAPTGAGNAHQRQERATRQPRATANRSRNSRKRSRKNSYA